MHRRRSGSHKESFASFFRPCVLTTALHRKNAAPSIRTCLTTLFMNRRANLVRVIRSLWESLDSHLDFTCTEEDLNCTTCGDRSFQRETVRGYARDIKDLADLL